jgi:ABC-type polysaccharide/polyol phosphate export permease/GT2 family glycosyltransferase
VTPEISIVVPTNDRVEWLRRCLSSLQAQEEAPSYELLVCAPPDPTVREVITTMIPDAVVLVVPHATPAERRNAVLPLARGKLVLFLDDDVEIPPHYLATLAEQARRHPDIQVFGGPNVTPADSTRFQTVQGAVLSSLLGAGPARRRYGPHPTAEADERWFTLCNLAIRREDVTLFDADLVCAEENELLDRLRRAGARMRYEPELWAAHERRGDLHGFVQQMFKYGRGRGQLARRSARTLRPEHLVPSATILALIGLLIATAVTGNLWLLVIVAAYPLALLGQSAKVAVTLRRPTTLLSACGITAVLHAGYGTGVLIGLLEPATGPARQLPTRNWHMLRILVQRQLLLLRKRSVLGLLWPVVTPLVMLALYSFVFHSVLNVPIPRYRVFLFAGLLPWSFVSQTLGTAITSLSYDAELIRRARFSYSLLPLASEIAASTYFLATLAVFVGYLGAVGDLNWSVLPAIVLPVFSLYFLVGAIACVLALIDVYNRDLRQVLSNILTVWFFLTPIVYQQQALHHGLLFTRSVDPLNLIIGEFRDVLYYGRLQRPLHDVIVLFATGGLLLLATSLIKRADASLPKDV